MELLLILLIVLVAVVFMGRRGPTWYRSRPRRVVRYEEDVPVVDEPVTRRRVVEDL